MLFLLTTSCKQQTENSHSQDERINQAAESEDTDLSEEQQAELNDLLERSKDEEQTTTVSDTEQEDPTQDMEDLDSSLGDSSAPINETSESNATSEETQNDELDQATEEAVLPEQEEEEVVVAEEEEEEEEEVTVVVEEEEDAFTTEEGNLLTIQSQSILNKYCISCHGNFPSTNQEWIANSRVIPGDPENSNLIRRMKVCSTGSQANMPKNSNQASDEECQVLNLWIEYLYQLENETL